MKQIEKIMRTSPVIPVLVIEDIAHARPVAEALVRGGLNILEVTLRTECALAVIAEMAKVDGAIVGAGTITNPDELNAAIDAGAQFIVSPGLTDKLGEAAIKADIPFLPGIASAADIMRGLDLGLNHFKFFPAETSGGIPALKALSGPFGGAIFCPTGGVTQSSAPNWLALNNVLCVGGSWIVPNGPVNQKAIMAAASAAASLAKN